jgi:hypothetical protein
MQPWPPTHPALNVRSVTSINDHLVVGADIQADLYDLNRDPAVYSWT